MNKLRIRRRGYTRKSGVRVKKTSFWAKDKGAKGRTPKHKRWHRKAMRKTPGYHKIEGYSTRKLARLRRAALRKEIRQRKGRKPSLSRKAANLSVRRSLQAKVNVNPSRKFDRIAKSDIRHLRRRLR